MLIKIWSAVDGRLLGTLRGHAAEITDIAVNFENTLVAAGSCDKMIRVWCIKTTQPICVLTGHSGMITSVRFCPDSRNEDRYLVSTSSDGTVCFWSWNVQTRRFNLNPQKLTERIKQGAQLICFSFSTGGAFLAVGSSDHYVRVYHVSAAGGPAKVLEIQPHIDQVDSLQFSNLGLRFISGSKDGTANIWSFERQEWHNRTLQMSQTLPNGQTPDVQEMKTKLKVTMVGWSSDDAYVITAVNDHSIKVWESKSGDLKFVLKEHEDEVFVIEAHPVDPRIFLSGGHDGRIILWDLSIGKKIKMFYNQIEGQGYGAIFDCKWSPDGQMFASTDSHGHITIYGMGDRSRYMRVPDEVFFHTDYRPLIRDANHYVIDEQTQCAPHLMGPPFLVDIDGNPYPPHLQRLVPGREHCKDDQLVPYIAIQNERGIAEILEPRQEPANPIPEPVVIAPEPVVPLPAAQRPTIDDMIVRLQQERTGRSVPRVGEPAQGEPSGSSSHPALRRSGEVEGVRQSSGNWQSRSGPLRGIREYVHDLDKAVLNRLYKQIEECCIWEEQSYQRELKRKPLTPSANTNRDETERQRLTRRKKRLQQQRQGIRLTARQNSRALRADPEVELSDPSIDTSNNEEDWMDSESSSSDSSEEEWVSEDPRNRNKRTRSQRVTAADSDSEENHRPRTNGHRHNGDEASSSGLNRRTGRNRRPVNGNSARNERRSNRNREPRPSTSGAGSSSPSSLSATSSASSLPEANNSNETAKKIEIVSEYRYPEWLTEVKPRRTPYFPQVGDDVIYFRKGHELYVEAVLRQKLYTINSRPQPLNRKTVKDQQLVKVLDIEYEIRSPRLVKLKLACLDEQTNQQTGDTFVLKYHDMPDVIDFLVLHQYYENSIKRRWQVQDRFRAIVDDRWWFGRIASIENDSTEDQFQMYKILWDSGEEELMSPWDIESLDNRSQSSMDGQEVFSEELQQLMYISDEVSWDGMDTDYQCDRLIHGLEKIMETSWAEFFNAPVDLNEYPDYATMIAYPIDLNTIKERLNNRFYRSIDSVRFDVKFIQNNAQLYNLPHSMITRNARLVTSLCLQFIDRSDCQDPAVIQHEIQQNKEMYESTDSEFEEFDNRKRSSRKTVSVPKWAIDCKKLLHLLFHNVNSEPFREPIDLQDYPDYLTIVTTPMDLSTIREQLNAGVYSHPKDMLRDLKLVFTNSKLYNTNKQSAIFKMTCILQPVAMDAMNQILSDFKNQSIAPKSKSVPKRGKTNGTISEDQSIAQPSTSGYRSRTSIQTSSNTTINGFERRNSRHATQRNGASIKTRNGIGRNVNPVEDSDDEDYQTQTKFVNGNRRTRLQTRSTRTSRTPKRYLESENDEETEEEEQPSIETEDEAEETEVEEEDVDEEEDEEEADEEVESDSLYNGTGKRKRNGHRNQPAKRAKMSNGNAQTRRSARRGSSSTSASAAVSDSETNLDSSATEVETSPSTSSRPSRSAVRKAPTVKIPAKRSSNSSGSAQSPANSKGSRSRRQTRRATVNYTEDFDQDEQDESDYEYELGGYRNTEEMSSRGRRRKLKGQSRSVRTR
jgi:WD40 repeat protein